MPRHPHASRRLLPALLLALPLLLTSAACSSVGGVVTSSSTLHQARLAIYNNDLNAGINLYRIVLEEASQGSEDAAESRFNIALVRMSSNPELTNLGEARLILDAIQANRRGYKTLEVATLLGLLDRISALGASLDSATNTSAGQVAELQAEIARLKEELIKKDETLKKVNAALGAR